jgi:hypothetical protein
LLPLLPTLEIDIGPSEIDLALHSEESMRCSLFSMQ